jgi:hypothetical protein
MDDGSCLAFFEVPGRPFDFERQDTLDLHIARGVESEVFDGATMTRLIAFLLLLGIGLSTAGCVYEPIPPPGPGYERWCINHPYRCHG